MILSCFLNFRWDINVIQSLPESMKVVFNSIVELCDEIETTIVENGTSSLVFIQYVKQNVGLQIRQNYQLCLIFLFK